MDVLTDHEAEAGPDADLIALAAGGDPDQAIPDDAVPLHAVIDRDLEEPPLLPAWYMPAPMTGAPLLRGWRRVVAWVIVLAFVAVVASGLCSTYGELTT